MEMRFLDWSKFRTDFPTNRPLKKWGMPGQRAGIATGKMKLGQSPYLDDWLYVRSLLPEDRWKDVKITLPSPAWWPIQLRDNTAYDAEAYDSSRSYLKDMSAVVRQEIMNLYDAGV